MPNPDDTDAGINDEIYACLNPTSPKSFFLYAGAGSGKTRSLVETINRLRRDRGRQLTLAAQKIGVITYTNAACDEIKRRLEFDPLVEVSTIHAFSWTLIRGHNADIRAWLRVRLAADISELRSAQAKGRAGKASDERAMKIERKTARLAEIGKAKAFVYSPVGDNRERNALNHAEVIAMTSEFLMQKNILQNVLIGRHPVLLIDESQDTNKELMEALLHVEKRLTGRFSIGLFGDVMQRIYADGKVDLGEAIPSTWARPIKKLNYRCPKRVVRLINRIRLDADGQQQQPLTSALEGTVRLFVARSEKAKPAVEAEVARRMASISDDPQWIAPTREYKTLILEHHMAAKRLGFEEMFAPLYESKRLRTALLDGSLPGLRFFASDVLPLVRALRAQDAFAVTAILRGRSPLLGADTLLSHKGDQPGRIRAAKAATDALLELFGGAANPTLGEVLENVRQTQLLLIPESLQGISTSVDVASEELIDDDEPAGAETTAWHAALGTPFKQIEAYADYVNGVSPFATHQGVKGLEFPRVLAIIDDADARGFMFSYDKLFGAKEKSAADLKNESQGGETSIDRTRRLFYVICSRAERSLAITAYTSDPQKVVGRVTKEGWFSPDEVEVI